VYYLVVRRVVLRFFFVKSAMLCHTFVGLQCAQATTSVENISGPDLGIKTPVPQELRSEAEVKIDEATQTSASQGTTKPTTH
jgi:hypothetical protein